MRLETCPLQSDADSFEWQIPSYEVIWKGEISLLVDFNLNKRGTAQMTIPQSDKVFSGHMAELYHSHLTPLIFDSYARGMAEIVSQEEVSSVLEVAAGTGVVTRAMVDALGSDVSILATDLNQPMMDFAQSFRQDTNVRWELADALSLPMDDGLFDVVACQFAVMFFPDRAKAYSEARRVLKPGGRFVFSVWDQTSENEFADTVEQAVGELFPDDPPRFISRTPYGYFNIDEITDDIRAGGFTGDLNVETVTEPCRSESAAFAAVAFCQATPLRSEITCRDPSLLEHSTRVAREALTARFGEGAIEGKMQAHVFSIRA